MPKPPSQHLSIGLLYPGEMGTAVANLLRAEGHRIVTTLTGRGAGTAQNCRAAGIEELGNLQEVVQTAGALLVLVPPGAALAVAEQVRVAMAAGNLKRRLVYVDLNSVSPCTLHKVAEVLTGLPIDFVDGAISGPAARLASDCTLYLSGSRAGAIAALFEGKMAVQVLGDLPGQASTLRMLLSGLTKGVIALFVEMALAARQAGILEQALAAYRGSYSGIMKVVDRTLPTYPAHGVRRTQEMIEVENTLRHLGLCPTVLPGIRQVTEALANFSWPDKAWSVTEILEELHARRILTLSGQAAVSGASLRS